NTNRSDILMSVGGRLTKALSLDSLVQYNPNQTHTESYNVMARYRPEVGKLINFGYRFDRNAVPLLLQTGILRQTDISAQWPLFGRWQGVGRVNYSIPAKRATETLAGLEYNQACWAVRFVAQSIIVSTNVRNTGIFLQLELNDLVRVGSDPLDALRTSVFGYTKMNSLPAEQPVQGLR
ncbi:MAG: LPS assembly protein LptD, partial [Sideroxydans sp.]|nr:LPS assembly protein LptD [Sideroxyarcus sp.]